MCGRFTLTTDINAIAKAFNVAPSLQTQPRYNVAPTQNIVSVLRDGDTHLDWLRWGLIPSWAKDESIGSRMINARAETLAEKPSFKRLLRGRRCLVVADGFYEWKQEGKTKTPMYITMKDKELFAFAGLWDVWKSPDNEIVRSCTIITTEPNELMSTIHNRMPAILTGEAQQDWLNTDEHDEPFLLNLLKPFSTDAMEARPVSRQVNNPRYDSAELIA
ncbi:SOS response-associated peptidase [Ktedonosporobacter rubrisoli]|uniref:Abasic site processing protein n=1 Tax=Ktedonosporobacter rubrisoli TaxID=2509675 RepID=A0A4P6JVE2_KTERU|nr:SOS response-associated peptidase [Ktedonosporobacter rubrisoli]QBD79638.1 SOS response-associated peptidase [Ktedonosporobacter rubrisoli]